MAGSRIELEAIEKRFGATRALVGATVIVSPGTIHGLVGENGAGKSTLIKCLAGLYRIDGGTIRIDGAPSPIEGPPDARRHGFSFLHQELSLVPGFDAAENAFVGRPYPTRFGMVDRRAMRRAVAHVLAEIAPELPLDRPVRRLTIGERQIVEIARALLGSPRLIVLDEPTAALGAEEARRLHAIVRRLALAGVTVLYVSHRLGDVLSLCSEVTVLRDGATSFAGAVQGLDHDRLVALMSGTTGSPQQGVQSSPMRISSRDGNGWGEMAPDAPLPPAAIPRRNDISPHALLVEALQLDPNHAPIDLSLAAGEIVGLYGLVGSGRSRLLRTLWGARRPVSGRVIAAGSALGRGSIADALAAGLAYVPEDRRVDGLVLGQSVAGNLSLPHLATFRTLAGLPWPSRRQESRFATAIGRRLAVKFAHPRQRVGALSGGNQQKVLVGRWLRRTPRVLLLDEPTRGVDVRSKADLHRTLRDLAAEGTAILFATSDLEELLGLSDRIGIMRDGRWIATLAGADRTAATVLSNLFAPAGREPAR